MPSPVNVYTVSLPFSQPITGAAETVVALLSGLNVDRIQRRVRFQGLANVMVGTGGTSVTVTLRRSGVTGPIVGVAQAETVTAGSTYSIALDALDEPGEVANANYVLDVAVAGATGGSTVNYAYLGATVY
jgi:hypothetical protein